MFFTSSSALDNITNKLVLAKPDRDPEGNTRNWLMTHVMGEGVCEPSSV